MATKVFVSSNGIATFVCPKCGKIVRKNMSKYTSINKAVRIKCKCSCNHIYSAILERRKAIRKQHVLQGTYFRNKGDQGSFFVKDISNSGIKMEIPLKPSIKIGEKMRIEFILDDVTNSVIRREVVVRNVFDSCVGVEFISKEHYDKFGSYLLYDL